MERCRLTAVVPATDEPPSLERVRAAIEAADEPPEEILVVEHPAATGPARSRNAAAQVAGGDVLVFVDSDVLVHPDVFRRIRAAFRDDPGVTAIFGSYDDAPECRRMVSTFRNLLHHHIHQTSAGPAHTFWAGLGAIRRDAFVAAGGFDTDRFGPPSVEDVELGMRLIESGRRIELDPHLLGTHAKQWRFRDMVWTDLRRRAAPWMGVLVAHRRLPATLNLGWRHRLSALASLVLAGAAVKRSRKHGLAALWVLVLANRSFYALVARRGGPALGLLALPLHVVHHLTAVLAVPLGIAHYLVSRPRTPGPPPLEPLGLEDDRPDRAPTQAHVPARVGNGRSNRLAAPSRAVT